MDEQDMLILRHETWLRQGICETVSRGSEHCRFRITKSKEQKMRLCPPGHNRVILKELTTER